MADFFDVDVSTHSRLKAAGAVGIFLSPAYTVSTHSRLKAAGPTDRQTAQ